MLVTHLPNVELECYGSPSFDLASKLKALKAYLEKWNEDIFGNVRKHKND
jgi:uncharacterized protein Usg